MAISPTGFSISRRPISNSFLKSLTLRGLEKDFAWKCLSSLNKILSRQQHLQLSFTLLLIPPSNAAIKQTPHRIILF